MNRAPEQKAASQRNLSQNSLSSQPENTPDTPADVSLEEILAARDARVALQRKLLSRFGCTLVSFGLNIPGPHKTSPAFAWAFERECEQVGAAIERMGWPVAFRQTQAERTGYEGFVAVQAAPLEIKRALVDIEEATALGRLFDIDVLRPDGTKVSREDLGLPGRTCLLCPQPAFVCARSRAHSVEELICAIEATIQAARQAYCKHPLPAQPARPDIERETDAEQDLPPQATQPAPAEHGLAPQATSSACGKHTLSSQPSQLEPALRTLGLRAAQPASAERTFTPRITRAVSPEAAAQAHFENQLQAALRLALIEELDTTPKPGLVDRRDCGSHTDMDYALFVRSTEAVVPHLTRMGMAGYDHATSHDDGELPSLFPVIQAIGRQAEAAMFEATSRVNTHKGAIFTLGILAAAGGWQASNIARRGPSGSVVPAGTYPMQLQATVRALVGPAMQAQLAAMERTCALVAGGAEVPLTHGERVFCEHGIAGIRHEAALGFPCVFEVGLPALKAAGGISNDAKLEALLAIMEVLDDTNVITRSGIKGLELIKRTAHEIRATAPATDDPARPERLAAFNDLCRARRISPGGAADLLAASLFVFELEA